MEKEKIVLKNGTELPYDSIGFQSNALVIGIIGGDVASLEQTFRAAGQTNLEEIKQVGADGNAQATHKLYDVLSQIVVHIDVAETDAGEVQNVVEVHLAREEEWQAEIRHIKEQMAAGGADPEALNAINARVGAVEQDMQTVVAAITGAEQEGK